MTEDGYAVLTVTDGGRGFTPEVLARFAHSAHEMDLQHPKNAMSLGLTACKRIAETQGCALELRNAQPSHAKRKRGIVCLRIPCP